MEICNLENTIFHCGYYLPRYKCTYSKRYIILDNNNNNCSNLWYNYKQGEMLRCGITSIISIFWSGIIRNNNFCGNIQLTNQQNIRRYLLTVYISNYIILYQCVSILSETDACCRVRCSIENIIDTGNSIRRSLINSIKDTCM